jgi:hypothetical protein
MVNFVLGPTQYLFVGYTMSNDDVPIRRTVVVQTVCIINTVGYSHYTVCIHIHWEPSTLAPTLLYVLMLQLLERSLCPAKRPKTQK